MTESDVTHEAMQELGEAVKQWSPPSNPFSPWMPPFRYDAMGQMIWDSQSNRILDMRGNGFLTGTGALGLPRDEAARIQDDTARMIANLMNAHAAKGLTEAIGDRDKALMVFVGLYMAAYRGWADSLTEIMRALKKGMAHSRGNLEDFIETSKEDFEICKPPASIKPDLSNV